MKYIQNLIIIALIQSPFQLFAAGELGCKSAGVTTNINNVFEAVARAKKNQGRFLINCKSQEQIKLPFQGKSGAIRSNDTDSGSANFMVGKEELIKCAREINPVISYIQEEIDKNYRSEEITSFQESSDRRGMLIGKSFFDTLARRIDELKDMLVTPTFHEDDDLELIRLRSKRIVAQSTERLLVVQDLLIKFFKIITNQPCKIGDKEAVDTRCMVQQIVKKVDPKSVTQWVEWVDILCKWYNKFFTKEGDQPVQVPVWVSRTNDIQNEHSGSEYEAGEGRSKTQKNKRGKPVRSSSKQSKLLQTAIKLDDIVSNWPEGAGGAKRQLHGFKQFRDGRGSIINNVLNNAKNKVKTAFKPAKEAPFFKRCGMYILGGISKGIARIARWISYKTFLNKREFEEKTWEDRPAGKFWLDMFGKRAVDKEPESQPPRKWWQRLLFWKK